MHSDQMRKYDISDSIVQALNNDLVAKYVCLNMGLVSWIQRCHMSRGGAWRHPLT